MDIKLFDLLIVCVMLLVKPILGNASPLADFEALKECFKSNGQLTVEQITSGNFEKFPCMKTYFSTPATGSSVRECIDDVTQAVMKLDSVIFSGYEMLGSLKCLKAHRKHETGLSCLSEAVSAFSRIPAILKIASEYCIDTDTGDMTMDDCMRYQMPRSLRNWNNVFDNRLKCVKKLAKHTSHLECSRTVDFYLDYKSFFLDESFKHYYVNGMNICKELNGGMIEYCTQKDAAWAALRNAGEDGVFSGYIIQNKDGTFSYTEDVSGNKNEISTLEVVKGSEVINFTVNQAKKDSWVSSGFLDHEDFSKIDGYIGFIGEDNMIYIKKSDKENVLTALDKAHFVFKKPLLPTDMECKSSYKKKYVR